MKIFLIGFHSFMFRDIALSLQNRGWEILYWTGSKREFEKTSQDKINFPKVIFHNVFDAAKATPAPGIDTSGFEPVGADLIHALYECESLTLTMMGRLDTSRMDFDKRKHLYYEYVKYWNGVLKRFNPDAIVFSDVPHSGYNLVVYFLAKMMGIKTIMFKRLLIPSRMVFFEDFNAYQEIKDVVEDIVSRGGNINLDSLDKETREHFLSQSNPKIDSTPFYRRGDYFDKRARDCRSLPTWGVFAKNLKNFTLASTAVSYVKMLFHKRRILSLDDKDYFYGWKIKVRDYKWGKIRNAFRKEYLALQTLPDYKNKFIYVPLHYQPECATTPVGDVFADQILMIDILSASIPDDWVIYVKENIIQWNWEIGRLGRFRDYYKKIKQNKKVYLVPAETSTFDLILNSQAVATVTGTAGWEAILRSKPALVFGSVWYMHCEGAFRVKNTAECRTAVKEISSGFKIDIQKVINFLAAIDKISVRGYPNYKYQRLSDIPYNENIKNISQAIFTKLTGDN